MWYFLYNVGLILVSPVILLVLASKKRCRTGLPQRLGFGWSDHTDPSDRTDPTASTDSPVIWFHAVSLGEVTAVAPLVQALHARFPHSRMVVSTVTETGREAVEKGLSGIAKHVYAPLDFPRVVARAVDAIQPNLFIFVETELWPNLLRALAERRVPAVLVNGRLSTRSFRGYRLIKPFMARVLGHVTCLLMQSSRDAERITALGAQRERVRITGNIKFDQPAPPAGEALTRQALGLAEGEELLLAGSTHPGEEEHLLEAYQRLQETYPNLVLMLAPRHIERAKEVARAVRARGLNVRSRSERGLSPESDDSKQRPRVIVLETRGELASLYHQAVVAFVGGTLVPVGGHNLLEPAQWSKPVFFGPHTDHCADIAALLERSGGGVRVHNGHELVTRMDHLLRNRGLLLDMGQRGHDVVKHNRGALQRDLDILNGLLADRQARLSVGGVRPRGSLIRAQQSGPARPVLRLLSALYGIPVRARNWLYEHNWLHRDTLPRPVLSIGNVTVGGTGKTPVVILTANHLASQGLRVAVLSRGYGRRSAREPLLVSNGRSVLATPADSGDEPRLIADRCPGVIVAVGGDRHRVGRWVLDQFPVDCFVLDDGFQHRRLHRTVDLVLLDATDLEGMQELLPAGRLREPLAGLARASGIMVTRVDGAPHWRDTLEPLLTRYAPRRAVMPVRFTAESVVDVTSGALQDVGALNGKSGLLFSAVANPTSFRLLAIQCGLRILEERVYTDHYPYTEQDVKEILALARSRCVDVILTTEKDATKVAPYLSGDVQVLALRLGTDVVEGQERLEVLLQPITGTKPTAVCA